MYNLGKKILIFTIVALLIGGFYYTVSTRNVIGHITIDEINDVVYENDYSMVYFGDESEALNEALKLYKKDYLIKSYYATSDVTKVKEYLSQYNSTLNIEDNNIFAVYVEGEFEGVIDTEDPTEFIELIRKYLYGEIPTNERKFKVLSTSEEYKKKVNSNNYTVAVFGEKSCSYCNLYLPVINEIAGEYELDIYYFDKTTYDAVEYDEIMDLNFEIPAKCTTTGESTTMKAAFPKPMTIITRKGKFVDCIKGYVNKDDVLTVLEQYDIVEVKKDGKE